MEKQYIDILRKIGDLTILFDEYEQKLIKADGYYINYSENWRDTIKLLSDNDLISVFKGLTIAENHFGWTGGSAAAGVSLYNEIRERNIDRDLLIADWAFFHKGTGSYLPFGGRDGSKSVWESKRRGERLVERMKMEKKNKEIRILKEKIEGLNRSMLRQRDKYVEFKESLALALRSGNDIAREILNDVTRPVYYYTKEIEKIIADKSVDKTLLISILEKFKTKEKRNTKYLKDKLINEINNR